MSLVTHLECGLTGEILPAGVLQNASSAGKPLLVRYDHAVQRRNVQRADVERREPMLWIRWRELLPLPFDVEPATPGEVETPLVSLPATARAAGVARLDAKDESRLPIGSFKARGLVMAVNMARHFGVRALAIATNGNAGAAMAAYCARAGIEAHCFAPADTPEANLREIALHGAQLTVVDGMIDDCGRLVAQSARAGRWFNCATPREPYTDS